MKKIVTLCAMVALTTAVHAQTKIGDDPATPRDSSAMLEVSSTATPFRGFLMPRLTTTQRDAIAGPAKGLMIFNITSNQAEINIGTPAAPVWTVPTVPPPNAWLLAGNAGTDPALNFLGTTDNLPLVLRTNNLERLRLAENGFLGMGITTPGTRIHIRGTNGNPQWYDAQVLTENFGDAAVPANDVGAPGYFARRTGGTPEAPAALNDWDKIGVYMFQPYTPDVGPFYGHENSGMAGYSAGGGNGASRLGLFTSNKMQMVIDQNGFIGVGTRTPTHRFTVVNDNLGSGATDDIRLSTYGAPVSTNPSFQLYSAGGTEAAPTDLTYGTSLGLFWWQGRVGGADPVLSGLQSFYRGDGTTGYSDLFFLTSGFGRAVLDSVGNFGVGTLSPTQTLHVGGTARITGSAGTATDILGRDAEGNISNLALGTGLSIAGGVLSATSSGTSGWSLTGNTGTDPSANFLGTTDAADLLIRTDSVERMRIQGNGYITINGASPQAAMTLRGNTDAVNDDDFVIESFEAAGATPSFITHAARGTALAPANLANGDILGILDFRGYFGGSLNTDLSQIRGVYRGNGTSMRSDLVFRSSQTDQMRLDENGFLGLGNITPNVKLDVQATYADSAVAWFLNNGNTNTSHGIIVRGGVAGGSGAQLINFQDGGGSTIGTVTQEAGGTVAFNTSSDVRLKTNISNTPVVLPTIMKLVVKDYHYKGSNQLSTGLMAQDVYRILPAVVHVGGDDVKKNPWGIDYGKITPYLIKAIQEQQTEIESLKDDNKKLEARLQALEQSINSLKVTTR